MLRSAKGKWWERVFGLALAVLFLGACADTPVAPLDEEAMGGGPDADLPAFAVQLTCAVDATAGGMVCDPSSPATRDGGPGVSPLNMNLIVGSQHQFVRLANDAPVVSAGVWSVNVTVQNLTLQPMGTLDGSTPTGTGVRVFFVDEPNNGVVVTNHDGDDVFRGSEPAKYFGYTGSVLGADGVLSPAEVSEARRWEFELNGATEFVFSVLISTEVPDPTAYAVGMTRVSAGVSHACAEGMDGKLYCWGWNYAGKLGDGTGEHSTVPVAVAAPVGVSLTKVSVGPNNSCAEGSDNLLYCWGWNSQGQLGDGTNGDRNVPVAVSAPAGVALTGVSVGANHSCADGSDDMVYCWGYNAFGQLGIDTTVAGSTTPVAVNAPAGVTLSKVSAASAQSCAEGSDGEVYCWGSGYGPTPVSIDAPVTLTNVSVGSGLACAEGSDGEVYCWGSGFGATPKSVNAPVALSKVSAGAYHACAEGSDGELYCWGNNGSGQLGDGTTEWRGSAVAVQAPVPLTNVSAGGSHSCAEGPGGMLYCWGSQAGDGTTTERHTPVVVAGTGGS